MRTLSRYSFDWESLALRSSRATRPAEDYRLPWSPGVQRWSSRRTATIRSTAITSEAAKNAWDFANGTHFPVSAAREGIVTHVKVSSHSGCESAACVDLANYVVVDHGDGTSLDLPASRRRFARARRAMRSAGAPGATPRQCRIDRLVDRASSALSGQHGAHRRNASLRMRRRRQGLRRRRGGLVDILVQRQVPVDTGFIRRMGRPSAATGAWCSRFRRISKMPSDMRLVTIDRSTAKVVRSSTRRTADRARHRRSQMGRRDRSAINLGARFPELCRLLVKPLLQRPPRP